MRVLVIGSTGQVGRELMAQTPSSLEVIAPSSAKLDITSIDQQVYWLDKVKPELIINSSAYTAVDKAESEVEKAYAVNAEAIKNLAKLAAQRGMPIFHISTDYVFDGQSTYAYKENDNTCPVNVYGASKRLGEQYLAQYCPQHIILRTSWVFGCYGHNFVKTMLRLAQERTHLSIVADQRGCPTSAASIARLLWLLAIRLKTKQESFPWGVLHFANQPACTWYEFAKEIFSQAARIGLLDEPPELTAISSLEYPTPARRPASSILDCTQLVQTGVGEPPEWKDELCDALNKLQVGVN